MKTSHKKLKLIIFLLLKLIAIYFRGLRINRLEMIDILRSYLADIDYAIHLKHPKSFHKHTAPITDLGYDRLLMAASGNVIIIVLRYRFLSVRSLRALSLHNDDESLRYRVRSALNYFIQYHQQFQDDISRNYIGYNAALQTNPSVSQKSKIYYYPSMANEFKFYIDLIHDKIIPYRFNAYSVRKFNF